jgi:hypothetical protein
VTTGASDPQSMGAATQEVSIQSLAARMPRGWPQGWPQFHPTSTWPASSPPGRSCRRTSAPPSWRWSAPPCPGESDPGCRRSPRPPARPGSGHLKNNQDFSSAPGRRAGVRRPDGHAAGPRGRNKLCLPPRGLPGRPRGNRPSGRTHGRARVRRRPRVLPGGGRPAARRGSRRMGGHTCLRDWSRPPPDPRANINTLSFNASASSRPLTRRAAS